MPRFLEERFGVVFRFGQAVRSIDLPVVETGLERWKAAAAVVCSGDDFETLYPEIYAGSGVTRIKLQMMRSAAQPDGWSIGPALAAGLTLRFYPSFRICGTLPALERRIAEELAGYERWGIHVLVSQTQDGRVTIGDSHESGLAVDPFEKPEIDELVLQYLSGFLRLPNPAIEQRWHGVYAKHPSQPWLEAEPAAGVRVVTAPGGSGMTLSFGIAERVVRRLFA
jgi:FAD dependent oxidoreductase TIGR03364